MKANILILLLMIICFSCTEEFDTKLSDSGRRLVVEGTITDQAGPYYIRLTWSTNEPPHHSGDIKEDLYDPVKDALVVIHDEFGNVDTLIPSFEVEGYYYDPDRGYYNILYNQLSNTYDTMFISIMDFAPVYDRGFYKTTNFKAVPGRYYYLHIELNGIIYTASDYMHFVPEIDSLSIIKRVSEKDGEIYYVPLLYFYEPQDENNYYLIEIVQYNELSSRIYSANRLWEFSILSDEFLQPYVNGIVIENGQSPDGYNLYIYSASPSITLSSLSFNAYQYYKALIEQFKNDGGAYSLAPSSPPTNISNGALGFFRASAISEKALTLTTFGRNKLKTPNCN
jgi:hypothetical protein